MCYILAFACSVAGHLYSLRRIWVESYDSGATNFARIYVPHPLAGRPAGVEDILVRGPSLFLQFALIIIALSSLSWALLLLHTRVQEYVSAINLTVIMFTGSIVFGPGAVVSFALPAREKLA
jgi:hypothetical protein